MGITNIEPDTIKNALCYSNIVAMTLPSHYIFKKNLLLHNFQL